MSKAITFKITAIEKLVQRANKDLAEALSGDDLKKIKQKYIGKRGSLKAYFRLLRELSNSDRKELALILNKQFSELQEKIIKKEKDLLNQFDVSLKNSPEIDLTAPFDVNAHQKPPKLPSPATFHPAMEAAFRMMRIFREMGFSVHEARELDDDYHCFTSLNMPPNHPAREGWDTFYTDTGFIPSVHTSSMQNRIMKKGNFPIKSVIIGKCARNENADASHSHTFYQIEGIYVDKGITMVEMKGVIQTYLNAFFGRKMTVRIQPSHFPFVEPGLEYLIEWQTTKGPKWLEVIGAGMIHPFVLQEAGIDTTQYSGFAWGFGLERLALLKYEINDIRWLYSSDIRFLSQFTL